MRFKYPNIAFKASGSDTRVLFANVRAAALTWCWASFFLNINIIKMATKNTLLTIRQGEKDGTFIKWLTQLGVYDLIKEYSFVKLVEWRWLVPQHRVIFSPEFFLEWKTFPEINSKFSYDTKKFNVEFSLWDSDFFIDDEKEPYWFLNGFFRQNNNCYKRLREIDNSTKAFPIPDSFIHPHFSQNIKPYVDYYYHWQAYALIDIFRINDTINIVKTPDVKQRAINVANYYDGSTIKKYQQWTELDKLMTGLSHYRSLIIALSNKSTDSNRLRKKGALELAKHLKIDVNTLEFDIREKLLVLAKQWLDANKTYCKWTLPAWSELQTDIYLAVEWLCYLSGNNIEYYFDKWSYTDKWNRKDYNPVE